jgi:hypothetical protein
MAVDLTGLTDDELAEARDSYSRILQRVRKAIDTFADNPLPKDPLARDKLLESHNKLWHSTENALREIDELAYQRGLIG